MGEDGCGRKKGRETIDGECKEEEEEGGER
jgi:hypothetical protein